MNEKKFGMLYMTDLNLDIEQFVDLKSASIAGWRVDLERL
jgi:hypothetical protein